MTRRWIGRLIPRFAKRRRAPADEVAQRTYPVVQFYERLETLLARHGLARAENQTQHEFAVTAGGELRSQAALRPVAAFSTRTPSSAPVM